MHNEVMTTEILTTIPPRTIHHLFFLFDFSFSYMLTHYATSNFSHL